MARRNRFGERKRRIEVRDGDRITMVDRHGSGVLEIEFRGSEFLFTINVLGGNADTSTPVGLSLDPSLFGHNWPEE